MLKVFKICQEHIISHMRLSAGEQIKPVMDIVSLAAVGIYVVSLFTELSLEFIRQLHLYKYTAFKVCKFVTQN